jgi:hypothetical protein
MPDLIRHPETEHPEKVLDCETASQAGIQADSNWTTAFAGVTIIL